MNRQIGLVLLGMAWVAVIWGGLDEGATFLWNGERTSVAYFAAPLLIGAIVLLLRGDAKAESDEFE